jgi:serine/threonine protein kinase
VSAATQNLPARYRNVEWIARGAMGDIVRATDSVLGRVVAVKLLAEPFVADEDSRRRFAREARAAAHVSGHPNIVTIYDVGETAGRPYIVMEYIDGSSLEQRLHENGIPARAEALRQLEQVGRALDHAHANGVVHRDVKPGNLLVDRQDDLHVADFGIASAAWMPSLTADGTVLGTAGYLAPEQAQGQRATPASDRYALGVVAFELLTGNRPFARESPTAEAAAHASEPVPSVTEHGELPGELDGVFARALAKRPEDRYATCAETVAALRCALAAGAGGTRAYPAAPPVAPRALRDRPPRWPLLAAALGTALVAGVVIAVALSGTRSTHGTPTVAQTPTPPRRPAAHTLDDRARSLMRQGRYSDALPLLEQAVQKLYGQGPADSYEGDANYDLGVTLVQLGRCADALSPLRRSQALEPQNTIVSSAVTAAEQCAAPPPGEPEHGKGHGKGRGKHKRHG